MSAPLTVSEALAQLERYHGAARLTGSGSVELRYPQHPMAKAAASAIKANVDAVRALLRERTGLKGTTVELMRHGDRLFLVSDEEDAALVMQRLGCSRGEVWTHKEVELVAAVAEQPIRDEIACFKRALHGILRRE